MAMCKERIRLVLFWRDAVGLYFESLTQLAECRGNKAKFREQHKVVLSAQRAAEEARAAVAGNRAEHGC